MKNILVNFLAFFILVSFKANGQCEINFDRETNTFTLKNKLFERRIVADKASHSIYTSSFKDLVTKVEYCQGNNEEFSFRLNNTPVIGGVKGKMVDYKSHEVILNQNGSKTLRINLSGKKNSVMEGMDLSLFYEIYPDLPAVRKWLDITNSTTYEKTITNLEWEIVNLEIASPSWVPHICTMADIYGQYGQNVYKPPYIGRTDDPALLVYDYEKKQGAIIGNEAAAILKRTSIYADSTRISIGMGFKNENFPFEKTLKPGELFTSPKGFVILYHGSTWQDAFEGHLASFVRNYMGVKLFERKQTPIFFYNTWNPFANDINDKLIRDIADVISQAGVEYLIIDGGWEDKYGDWNPNKKKFPEGLKPVCDYIISKGMKPGLWISIATADDSSQVAKKHKDWFVTDKNGNIANLHGEYLKGMHTMNLCTPYYDYIKDKISYYVENCHIGYIKLDLAAVYSSYKLNYEEIGDYSTDNRPHKNKDESIYLLYSRVYQLIDELKSKYPDLYVDCTFELYGKVYGIDYSLIQHADGDWLSNITEDAPVGSLYMRQLCYERARVVPASSLLIGNLQMNSDYGELEFQSLLGATPMMLGDPRHLSAEKIKWFKEWSDWARNMEQKYNYTRYYQTSDIFTRPEMSGWDGCARINTEKGGGILCFYRNNSLDQQRTYPIIWVDENAKYSIYSPLLKKVVRIYTGKQLKNEGITVEIKEKNASAIFGIEKVE